MSLKKDKMKTKKGSFGGVIIGILFFLLFLVTLFEIILLAYVYINADEVECNLFWCTFKTTNTDIIQTIRCKINNQEVNCSDIINNSILNKIYEEYVEWDT